MSTQWREVTLESALLWLNDRLGKNVHASVTVDLGSHSMSVLAAEGVLRHVGATGAQTHPRDDIMGMYTIGGQTTLVDLTGLEHFRPIAIHDDLQWLKVELAEDVSLEIVEPTRSL
jgi:hypothetical protein